MHALRDVSAIGNVAGSVKNARNPIDARACAVLRTLIVVPAFSDTERSKRTAECACGSAGHAGRRIVLTGGPGAGKTAVLEVVQRLLCAHVSVLPEAAGIVFGGGFPRRSTEVARRAAQVAICQVQNQLERIALDEPNIAIALCDRGVVDGEAYWPADRASYWREVGLAREEALLRYDLVVHLKTPSASSGYNRRNQLRIESAAEAAEIDARILTAWEGHPHRTVIESTPDFMQKLARALSVIETALPPCCRVQLDDELFART